MFCGYKCTDTWIKQKFYNALHLHAVHNFFSSVAVVNIGEGTIIKLLNFLFVCSLLFLLTVGTGRFSALREVCCVTAQVECQI